MGRLQLNSLYAKHYYYSVAPHRLWIALYIKWITENKGYLHVMVLSVFWSIGLVDTSTTFPRLFSPPENMKTSHNLGKLINILLYFHAGDTI